MTLEQRGAYIDMIALQMLHNGPVPDDPGWLAHQLHVSHRKARKIVEDLILATKLRRIAEGLTNDRAERELVSRASRIEAAKGAADERWKEANPSKTQADVPTADRDELVMRYGYDIDIIRVSSADHSDMNAISNDRKIGKRQQKQRSASCDRMKSGDAEEMPRTRALDSDIIRESRNDRLVSSDRDSLALPLSDFGKSDVDAGPSKTKRYSDDFEVFWKAYPETRGMSKIRAWGRWRKLSPADRQQATAALPAFAEHLAERRKRQPDLTCLHAEGYLSQRRFETLMEDAKQSEIWWRNPEAVARMTRDRWIAGIKRFANGHWPVDKLAPAPGNPSCLVPADLVRDLRLTEIYDQRGLKRPGAPPLVIDGEVVETGGEHADT